jgi:hypothetical protein
MALADFSSFAGRQRAVWAQPGGRVLVGGTVERFDAVIIEAGTAVREGFVMRDDETVRRPLSIPIMVVPAGALVLKTVAVAAPATIFWNEAADHAVWGVDEVHVEEDTSTRQLSLVADMADGGTLTNLPRVSYHITIFLQKEEYHGNPESLIELEL